MIAISSFSVLNGSHGCLMLSANLLVAGRIFIALSSFNYALFVNINAYFILFRQVTLIINSFLNSIFLLIYNFGVRPALLGFVFKTGVMMIYELISWRFYCSVGF